MTARYASLAVFLALVVLAAGIGSRFEAGASYLELVKPAWTPAPWLLAAAGVLVYLAMALAAWQVWLTRRPARIGALTWWFLQLAAYTAWSWLFFGLERPGWAWMEMSLLIVMVIFCVRVFHRLCRPAAYLMAFCLLWLMFTWLLNLAIWTLNGGYFAQFLA